MFGPRLREEEILWIVVDARVGGAFSFLVRRGEMAIDYVGTYQQLERPKRWAEYAARTEAGWTRMLEALTELLAQHDFVAASWCRVREGTPDHQERAANTG